MGTDDPDAEGGFDPVEQPSYISLVANIGLFFLALAFGVVWLIAFYGWLKSSDPSSASSGLPGLRWWFAGLVVLCVLLAANTFGHRKFGQLVPLDVRRRNLILAFGSIFLLVAAVSMTALLKPHSREFTYELVFILAVCVLPAATYYLFLMSRRPSILNEFISNLKQFGLLERMSFLDRSVKAGSEGQKVESLLERSVRVNGYFLRFEAMYGQLRFSKDHGDICDCGDFVDRLLTASDADEDKALPRGATLLSDIFRANLVIPLGITTVLCLIGWFVALNPHFDEPKAKPAFAVTAAVDQASRAANIPEAPETESSVQSSEALVQPDESQTPSPAEEADAGGDPDTTEAPSSTDNDESGEKTAPPFELADTTSRGLETKQGVMEFGPAAFNFAFLGAYFFGIQMLFRRFVHRDLGPNAFLAFATRIILAVIAVSVVIYCLPDSIQLKLTDTNETWSKVALVVAFTVGFFPQLVWKYIRALFVALSLAKFFVPNFGTKQPLNQLDGLTVWQEVRLEEEDVENVPNFASADVVDLMLRTRIPPERLVFWVDQAILLTVLGWGNDYTPKGEAPAAKLRDLGIKTATQFYDATAETAPGRTLIKERLGNIDGKLSILRRTMELEPNFRLVRNWRKV